MAKEKTTQPKITLEREYTVPLRQGFLKVPEYKRANKAVKTLREFIARHMKLYHHDLRNVKIDTLVNNEIRFRGMKKPLSKIRVNAKKYDNNTISVSLVNVPEHIKYEQARALKKKQALEKKASEKEAQKQPEQKKEEKAENKEESKEKKETTTQDKSTKASTQAKQQKHTTKDQNPQINRKTLSR